MDLDSYKELTGATVTTSQEATFEAQILRQQATLEQLLGFTLDSSKTNTNLYNELGKTKTDCSCPDVGDQDLNPADTVVGAYRIFDYNADDEYLHVDPFTKVHKVKLIYSRFGEAPTGVTLREFNKVGDSYNTATVHFDANGLSKYIRQCWEKLCICSCTDCVQLAVDADWGWTTGNIPTDLLYVWADMVTHYANPKRRVKSESITSHSYTLADEVAPEKDPTNLATIKKYAGPNGSAVVMPI